MARDFNDIDLSNKPHGLLGKVSFLEELNEVAPPEKLVELYHPYRKDGVTNFYTHRPTKAMTIMMDPRNPTGPRDDIHFAMKHDRIKPSLSEAIMHLSKVDNQIEEFIKLDKRRIMVSTSEYTLRFLSALHGSREASSSLGRLHKIFNFHDIVGDKTVDYGELLEMVEEFTREGNPFKVLEHVSKGHPSPDEMLLKIDQLKCKCNRAIAAEKLKRTMTTIAFSISMVGFTILSEIVVLPSFAPTVMMARAAADACEASRKAKEDDLKEKKKGVAEVKHVFTSCNMVHVDHGLASSDYEKLMEFVKHVGDKIKSVMDENGGAARGGFISKEVMDVAEKAVQLKEKIDKLEASKEQVKSLATSIEANALANEAMEDLKKQLNISKGSKKRGLLKKLFSN